MQFKNISGEAVKLIHNSASYNFPETDEPFTLSDSNRSLNEALLADARFECLSDHSSYDPKPVEPTPEEVAAETPKNVLFKNITSEPVALISNSSRVIVPVSDEPQALSGSNKELIAVALEHPGLKLVSDKKKVVEAEKVVEKNRARRAVEKKERETEVVPPAPALPKVPMTEAEKAEDLAKIKSVSAKEGTEMAGHLTEEDKVAKELEAELKKA